MDKKVKNIRILKRISKTIFFNAIGEHYSVELIIKLIKDIVLFKSVFFLTYEADMSRDKIYLL